MEEIDGRRTKFPLFTPKKTRQPLLWSKCLHMIGQNEGTWASFNSRRKFKFPRVMNCPIRSVFIISTENQSELESSPGFPRALPRRQSCAKEKSSGVENVRWTVRFLVWFSLLLAILLQRRVKLWTAASLVLIICDLWVSVHWRIVSFQLITKNPLKNNTFETNMSNSAHNVSAKCTAGSVVPDSSPDGSSTCSPRDYW